MAHLATRESQHASNTPLQTVVLNVESSSIAASHSWAASIAHPLLPFFRNVFINAWTPPEALAPGLLCHDYNEAFLNDLIQRAGKSRVATVRDAARKFADCDPWEQAQVAFEALVALGSFYAWPLLALLTNYGEEPGDALPRPSWPINAPILKGSTILNQMNASQSDGKTLLHKVIVTASSSLLRYLIQNGADARIPDSLGGTPLMDVLFSRQDSVLEKCKLLIDAGSDINAISKEGKTALYCAALRNNEKAIALLIEHGARRESLNPNGQLTPETARKVLKMFADVEMNKMEDGMSLEVAPKKCRLRI